jgi:hypothetical protein
MPDEITITVKRTAYYGIGVRLWFVVMDTEGKRYQRWSNDMDYSDEVLMLAQPDDKLIMTVGEDIRHATVNPDKSTLSNVIRSVAFA